jgi:hypothetical protein
MLSNDRDRVFFLALQEAKAERRAHQLLLHAPDSSVFAESDE